MSFDDRCLEIKLSSVKKHLKIRSFQAIKAFLSKILDIGSSSGRKPTIPPDIQKALAEGYIIRPRALATISPYLTAHIKRFGDYTIDDSNLPQPLETAYCLQQRANALPLYP